MRMVYRKADIRFEECCNISIDENLVALTEEFVRVLREVGPKLPGESVVISVDGLLCEIRKTPEGV